jgi:hypothetical protein
MFEDEPSPAACLESAVSILQCLQMLVEEADNLSLSRTTLALQKAIRACRTEQSRASSRPRPRRCQIIH